MPHGPNNENRHEPVPHRLTSHGAESVNRDDSDADEFSQLGEEHLQKVDPQLRMLCRLALALERLEQQVRRIGDQRDLATPDKVGTDYVANRLGWTAIWVAEQARDGRIPADCVVTGTGNGKPWKFYRRKIDAWIDSR